MGSTKKGARAKEKSGAAFMSPLTPNAALAEIVGGDPMPRTEVTKRVWDYIREHRLQDPNDKRTIRADAKLKLVLKGKDSVDMFELTKMINENLHGPRLSGAPSRDPDEPDFSNVEGGSSLAGDVDTYASSADGDPIIGYPGRKRPK